MSSDSEAQIALSLNKGCLEKKSFGTILWHTLFLTMISQKDSRLVVNEVANVVSLLVPIEKTLMHRLHQFGKVSDSDVYICCQIFRASNMGLIYPLR